MGHPRCGLQPFTLAETTEYITTRIQKAGGPDKEIFSPQIIAEIHARSQGIPRLINAICDNLLLTCFAMETKLATIEMLDEVSKDMRLEWPGSRPRGQRSRQAEGSFEQTPFYTRGD